MSPSEVEMYMSHKTPVVMLMALALASMPVGSQSPTFTTITGEVGPGALYEIALPTGVWNGDLVVYAHGIGGRVPSAPIALPDYDPKFRAFRESVASQGFALVYSSYSVNGYGMMKDGTQRTHQLRGLFASSVGQPSRTYLVGDSMGGLIAVKLVESFPDQYNGALSLCGILAGGVETVSYLVDAKLVFDYFFPGVAPDSLAESSPIDFSPGSPTYEGVRAALVGGLSSPGLPTRQFATAAKLPAIGAAEMVQGGMAVIGMNVTQGPNLLDVTNGHMFYDNSRTWYTGSDDDVALNAGIARYVSDPSAINYLEHYYRPSGALRVPLLTLSTARDPISPKFHEARYKEAAVQAGAESYLLQLEVDAFGHCGLPTFAYPDFRAVTGAFSTLVAWVSTGVKPQD